MIAPCHVYMLHRIIVLSAESVNLSKLKKYFDSNNKSNASTIKSYFEGYEAKLKTNEGWT